VYLILFSDGISKRENTLLTQLLHADDKTANEVAEAKEIPDCISK